MFVEEASVSLADVIEMAQAEAQEMIQALSLESADPGLRERVRKQQMPALPSLRTLDKARRWKRSAHLDLIEELLAECGVPDPVAQLVNIMDSGSGDQWRGLTRSMKPLQSFPVCRPSSTIIGRPTPLIPSCSISGVLVVMVAHLTSPTTYQSAGFARGFSHVRSDCRDDRC